MPKKRKLRLSAAERRRRRLQAKRNFGTVTRRSSKVARKKRKSSRKGMSKNMRNVVGGIGYAVLGEPILDMVASKVGLTNADEFIKGLGGWFVSQNTSGVIRAMGNSAVNVSAYKLGGQQFGNLLGNLGNQPAPQQNNNGATF